MSDILLEFGAYKTLISKRALISRVKEHPLLWDKHLPEYKDKKAKADAWKELCKEITPEWETLEGHTRTRLATEMIKKWQHIRDAYVKYIRNSKIRPTTPYLFSSMLTFLNPFIEITEVKSDTKISSAKKKISLEENYEDIEMQNPSHSDVDAEYLSDPLTYDTIVKVLTNVIEKEDDEDRAFFNSITSQVKLLTNDSKTEFRIATLKLLRNLLQKDETNSKTAFLEERLDTDSE